MKPPARTTVKSGCIDLGSVFADSAAFAAPAVGEGLLGGLNERVLE